MRSLVIVESPAKAKTISNFLGKDYQVEASYGHVRDLPSGKKEVPEEFRSEKWADFAVNVEDQFQPIYVISDGKKKQIALLKRALKDADQLLLATDEDREGESISWHLLEVLKPPKGMPVRRIVFHEITREAIRAAIESPRELDIDLVHAQEGRRIVDRLFGYKLSPVLWRKVQPGLSAGRVQSAAVRLIVEREEDRRRFVTSEYWDLEAAIGSPTGIFKATMISLGGKRLATGKDFDSTTGQLSNKNVVLLNEQLTAELQTNLQKALPWRVKAVDEKPATQRPYPPFTTSTLQQEANRKLGFGAKRTMQIAQRLYEGVDLGRGERVGLITYMRTDSVTLSSKALNDAQTVIRDIYGPHYAKGPRQYQTKTRNAQEAHEAIRPTEMSHRPQDMRQYLEKDDLAIYELIWKRTMASQMPEARLLRTIVEIAAQDAKGEAVFSASGKKILFPGYLRAYVEGSDDPTAEIGDQEVILPDLQVGQQVIAKAGAPKDALVLDNLANKKHETAPPARYSEASLVKKLEEEGIGRPSTYASIISTIQDRGYVYLNKSRQLIPTFTAMAVINLLRDHFGTYVDLKFTARMEEELDQIAGGELTWVDSVRAFYRGTNGTPGLEEMVESKQKTIPFPDMSIGNDPESGLPITVRVGKFGPYLMRGENGNAVMATIPQDVAPADLKLEDAVRMLSAKQEGPKALGSDPETGLTVYASIGRFGPYVQIGETPEDKKAPKPKRASLERGQDVDALTLEDALKLLTFPKVLGKDPESGEPILVNKGKFGPYVQREKEYRSLKKTDDIHEMTLARALELLAEPKGARRGAQKSVLNDLGEGIQVLDGKYGAYVTDGKNNATLPKDADPAKLTVEEAKGLLAAKKKGSGAGGQGSGKKAPAKKASAKKAPAKKK